MPKPNFFIIGAPKCGTTSIAKWLSEHPQIYFSPRKEPHYFNTDEDYLWRPSYEEYLQLFEKATPQHKCIGEGSVYYLYSKVAVSNIEKFTNGKAKYIVCLRNPVDMVVSLHNQKIVSGVEKHRYFKEAWEASGKRDQSKRIGIYKISTSTLNYRDVTLLGQQVKNLLNQVGQERIHFVFLDEMKINPSKIYSDIISFLGLKNHDLLNYNKENSSKAVKNKFLKELILFIGIIKVKMGLNYNWGLLSKIEKLNERLQNYPSIHPIIRNQLIKYYKNDILLLEDLLQKDLSKWKI